MKKLKDIDYPVYPEGQVPLEPIEEINDHGGPEKGPEPMIDPYWEKELKIAEMDKQIAYTEKIQLRELRIKSFEFAKMLKPDSESSNSGTYDVEKYISDANKIYQELIKES